MQLNSGLYIALWRTLESKYWAPTVVVCSEKDSVIRIRLRWDEDTQICNPPRALSSAEVMYPRYRACREAAGEIEPRRGEPSQ